MPLFFYCRTSDGAVGWGLAGGGGENGSKAGGKLVMTWAAVLVHSFVLSVLGGLGKCLVCRLLRGVRAGN